MTAERRVRTTQDGRKISGKWRYDHQIPFFNLKAIIAAYVILEAAHSYPEIF
jgi:hypothetical protein